MTKQQQQVKWTLTEIKNDIVVQEYDLTKMLHKKDELTILIGRQEDIVDIIQYHDSISRRHATLVFNNDALDTVTIYDLNSTHGVHINNNKMMPPPPSAQKIDSSTGTTEAEVQQRTGGVQIHSGDVIKLGESTRYFVIEQQSSKIQEGNIFIVNNAAASEHHDQTVTSTSSEIDIDAENDVSTCTNVNKTSLDSKSIQIQYNDEVHDQNNQACNNTQQLPIDQIPEKYQKEWNHIVTMVMVDDKKNMIFPQVAPQSISKKSNGALNRCNPFILAASILQAIDVDNDFWLPSSVLNMSSPHLRLNVENGTIINTKKQNCTTASSHNVPSQTKTLSAIVEKHDDTVKTNTSTSIDSNSCTNTVVRNKAVSPQSNISKESQHQHKSSSMIMVDEKKKIMIPQLAPKSISKKSIVAVKRCNPFILATSTLQAIDVENDFCLPRSVLKKHNAPAPNAKPISRSRIRRMKKIQQGGSSSRRKKQLDSKYCPPLNTDKILEEPDDYTFFKDTCARIDNAYMSTPSQSKTHSILYPSSGHEIIRNLREHVRKSSTNKQINPVVDTDRINSGRAARANQRRLLKDFSSFGGSATYNLGLLDALSNREPQLRFNRSSIHAWGVFADEDISADEMIIEYRGELIENAMAEKREKVYEAKKIGSDYMFRIDADLICDATKQGNVARFINASCDPNCYTKIISLDGTKRIVIYAKRDICTGEELCYDYKFPIEYDETKRISCHCGARDCRGFMNWDKKYAASQSKGKFYE